MTDGEPLILFLPADGGALAPGSIDGHHGRVVAIAPVAACGMAHVDLPALAPAQAAAAARLQLADRLSLEAEPVHLVVADGNGLRPVCWVAERLMRVWQDQLAALELVPDAIIPAALVMPPPPEGAVRFVLGGETLVAAGPSVWRDDPVLTSALTAAAPVTLDADESADALRAAAASPPLNLLSGAFAQRKGWRSDGQAVRMIALLLAALILVSLLIPVAQAWSIHRAADRLEAQARQIARARFPEAADPLLAARQTRAGAFPARYAALAAAIETSSGAELAGLSFTREGVMDARVRVGAGAAARDAFISQLSGNGLQARLLSQAPEQGRNLLSLRLEGL